MAAPHRTNQDLVDYLVTAILEQDAPFVLFWLDEMKARGMLAMKAGEPAEGVAWFHSWRPYTALTAAVDGEDTRTRRFVLECLLHFVPRCGNGEARATAIRKGRTWATEVMARWETGGREKAHLAAKALALSPGEAADLIDEHDLAPSPDAVLTGDGPLPLPAEPSTVDVQYQIRAPPLPPPVATTSFPHNLFTSADNSSATMVRAHIGNLPPTTTQDDIVELLRWAEIPFRNLATKARRDSLSAYLTLPSHAAYSRASSTLHTAHWHGRVLHFEPNAPDERHRSSCDPTVVLRPLPVSTSDGFVRRLARAARCGAYDERAIRAADGRSSVGVFRVANQAWGEEAVRYFDGTAGGAAGAKFGARWYQAGETSWEREERERAHEAVFLTVEKKDEDEVAASAALTAPRPGLASAQEDAPTQVGDDLDGDPLEPSNAGSEDAEDDDLDGEPISPFDLDGGGEISPTSPYSALFPSSPFTSTSSSTALPYPTPTPEPDYPAAKGSKRPADEMAGAGGEEAEEEEAAA